MFRPMHSVSRLALALVVTAPAALPAHAFNTQFMNNTPLSKMTTEDVTLFKAAVYAVLDEGADGSTRPWSNPKTRAGGEITAVRTFEERGESCRELEIANSAGGLTNRSLSTLCRVPGGNWRLKNN